MVCRKIFGLTLLIKIEAKNLIGKSLNLAPLLYRCHDAPKPTTVMSRAGTHLRTLVVGCRDALRLMTGNLQPAGQI